ncbi:MAG: aspartate aminotransferase family protein [Pseudomonadota bacterium]
MISPVLPTYSNNPLGFERGEGAWLITAEGERYLDFMAGIAVNALGHCHPHLVEALKAQSEKLWHTSNVFRIDGQVRLAERLVAATFADTVFFTNSGTEAIECAIKMARRAQAVRGRPERYRLVTFEGAFHGRSLAAIAAGGQEKYLEGFGPPMAGFDQVPVGDEAALSAALGPETAGILVEPIQGEGGVRVVPDALLQHLRDLCTRHDLLLVFDEVQCGVGRTGRLFAHEVSGVTPDIMAIAKGIGGGFPLGACLATEAAGAGMTKGTHGSTFGGNPLAVAVGHAVLDVVMEHGFLDRVNATAGQLRQSLLGLKDRYPTIIDEVRGTGLMLGLKTRVENIALVEAAREEHLLAVGAGENVVRLLPPLTIGEAEIGAAIGSLERACERLLAAEGRAAQ